MERSAIMEMKGKRDDLEIKICKLVWRTKNRKGEKFQNGKAKIIGGR